MAARISSTRKEPAVGTRFGKWTVVANTVLNKHKMTQSVCECECGKFEVIINANLREGKSTQCRSCSYQEKLEQGKGTNQKLKPADVQAIRTALRNGDDPVEIGLRYDVSTLTIYYIDRGVYWRKLPWPEGLSARESRSGGRPRLTHDDVKIIKQQILDGVKQRDLASRFGVSENTISMIKLGRSWNWVKP